MRRPFLTPLISITGLLLLAAPALAASAAPAPARPVAPYASQAGATDDWPQVGYGPGVTSDNSRETTIGAGNVGHLGVAWNVPDTAARCWSTCSDSGAAAVGGVVYQSTAYGVFARDAATGALRWRAPLGADAVGTGPRDVRSFPAVADGMVLVGFGQVERTDMGVAALSAATGKTLWTLTTASKTAPAGNLTLVNGVLYVDVGGRVYAVTARTGHVLWHRAGYLDPAVVDGRVYVLAEADAGNIDALSAKTGRMLWRFQRKQGVRFPSFVMVTGGVVYSGAGEQLYELNASTGALEKTLSTGCELREQAGALASGVAYVICGGKPDGPAYAVAISVTSGKHLWKLTFGRSGGADLSTPVVANGVLYLESFANHTRKNTVEAVGATSGKTLWSAGLPIKTNSDLTVAEGRLFASLTTGITAFAPRVS
jgi:outer membrane protein assembly factor BamB